MFPSSFLLFFFSSSPSFSFYSSLRCLMHSRRLNDSLLSHLCPAEEAILLLGGLSTETCPSDLAALLGSKSKEAFIPSSGCHLCTDINLSSAWTGSCWGWR